MLAAEDWTTETVRVVYPTAPFAEVVGRTDVVVKVDDANDTDEDVAVKRDSDDVDSSLLVLDAASLVTGDSLEDGRDDETGD